MPERHEIDAFLALAEELHFGRTAQRLGISTSRVSQTIRQLERRVGVPLFTRTSRRVRLTPVGDQLAEELRPAWERVEASLDRAIRTGRGLTGTLHVGFVGPAGGQLVARATEAFEKQAPDCQVVLREVPTLDVEPWLGSGEVDVALTVSTRRTRSTLSTGPGLVREAVLIALAGGHPFAGRRELTVADLARVELLHLDGMPELAGAEPPRERVATLDEALTLVGMGRGVLPVGAHVRRYHPRPDLAFVPARDAPQVEWRLHWLPDRATTRVRAFSDAAAAVVTD